MWVESDVHPSRKAVVAKEMRQSASESLRITLRRLSLSAERRLHRALDLTEYRFDIGSLQKRLIAAFGD